jgi:hypothetical protein
MGLLGMIIGGGSEFSAAGQMGPGALGRAIDLSKHSAIDFAQGGSFTVGGSGGQDSQLVAFNATPGETVDIRTRGQGRGMTMINNFNISTPTGTIPQETQNQIAAKVGEATQRAMSRNR